jgi:hypothetical protein
MQSFFVLITLFSVSRSSLTRHAQVFVDMLSLPQGSSTTEGQTIDNPIYVYDTPIDEFEALLDMISAAETSFDEHVTINTTWSTWLAAEARWEAAGLTVTLANILMRKDIIHALLLDFARRFHRPDLIWPVIFHLCIREVPISEQEISILTRYTKERVTISAVRTVLEIEKHNHKSRFWTEMRVRELLSVIDPQLEEPRTYSSGIPPPQTGYRYCVGPHAPFPQEVEKVGMAPFVDANSSPLYVGTANLKGNETAMPAKIIGFWQNRSGVTSYADGDKERHDAHSYSILFVDEKYMEWISAIDGQLPSGRTPVLGGYDMHSGGDLYHAYGRVGQWNTPGKTSPDLGGAKFPFSWQVHDMKDKYFILVWKPRVPGVITLS